MHRKEGRLCQQITIMRKAMTNYTCFAHNFLIVLVRNRVLEIFITNKRAAYMLYPPQHCHYVLILQSYF